MNPPKEIKVKFTEEDRQNARIFTEPKGCLLDTALDRIVGEHKFDHLHYVVIDEIKYEALSALGKIFNHADREASQKPFYKKSVVGLELTLTRQ